MSNVANIADSIVAELNAGSFSQSFTAERHYRPLFDLADMKTLRVSVVPRGQIVNPGSRTRNAFDYSVDVAVQKKLDAGDNAEFDPLLSLVEEVADHFRLKRLASFPEAIWIRTANEPIYATEHLDELRQFTSVLTLTYRVHR